MLKPVFFLSFILIFASSLSANDIELNQSQEIKNFDEKPVNYFTSRKDPFLAGILSSVMPGVGQIYSEEYTKGSLVILGDFIGKASLITVIVSLTTKYSSSSNDSVSWERLSGGDKALLLSVAITYLGFYIWNIIDAVESANDYNAKYLREPSITLTFNSSNNGFMLGFRTLF